MNRIVMIDDDRALCRSMQLQLEHRGHQVRTAHSGTEGQELCSEWPPEIVFLDLGLPDMSGLEVLQRLREENADLLVVMITGTQDMRATIEAMREGAFDYLRKPFELDEIIVVMEKASRLGAQVPPATASEEDSQAGPGEIVGKDRRILDVLKQIGLLSQNRETVLVEGESGTGKELVARALHEAGTPAQPFVAINCSAIVATLPESELFGHEKGAFTGADQRKTGRLEHAGEGTLFLDEIGDLAPDLQAKLLRVLQEREFERVGGLEPIAFRARVIAATHRDLKAEVAAGRFREDLFFRLAVARLRVPALRDRQGDIPLLANHLIQDLSKRLHRRVSGIHESALVSLMAYDWPGNVRELQSVLARAITLSRGDVLTAEDFEPLLRQARGRPEAEPSESPGEDRAPVLSLREAEKEHIGKAYRACGGNVTRTAKLLEISPTTLRKKLKGYGLRD